jgi:DNA-binding GntR family transcriptional regulator
MFKKDSSPAIDKALNFIKERLDNGYWPDGTRLPSIRFLARTAGVSKVSMTKAVARLKTEQCISGQPGARTWVGKPVIDSAPSIASPVQSWQRIRQTIEKDISSGVFGIAGSLPSLKELQAKYGVCFRTMQKIICALEADGVLLRSKRGHIVPNSLAAPRHRKMVFITMMGHYSQASALNSEHNRIVNQFENECMRIGLHLDVIEIDFFDSVQSRLASASIPFDDSVLGYILDVWWYIAPGFQEAHYDLLDRLVAYKKPVAILDELSRFILPVKHSGNPFAQVFTIQGTKAGERMARYLIGLGHRSAAYITLMHNTEWSHNRYNGARAPFTTIGNEDSFALVSGTITEGLFDLFLAAGLDDATARRFMTLGRTPLQIRDMQTRWAALLKGKPRTSIDDPAIIAEIKRAFRAVVPLIRQGYHDAVLVDTCTGLLGAAARRAFACYLRPLFDKAITHGDATAWICATDGIALAAIQYLRKKGKKVSGDISVVGFDNTPLIAIENRLTTFDFNAAGFIHSMLNFITRPPRPRGLHRHQTIEVDGIIMERDSAGKARKI